MSVIVTFRCDGCEAVAEGTAPLRRVFQSVSGRPYGIGGAVQVNSVVDVAPSRWTAYDPWTYATYCPKCSAELFSHAERVAADINAATEEPK